jgi:hypothetical protein
MQNDPVMIPRLTFLVLTALFLSVPFASAAETSSNGPGPPDGVML